MDLCRHPRRASSPVPAVRSLLERLTAGVSNEKLCLKQVLQPPNSQSLATQSLEPSQGLVRGSCAMPC